MKFGAIAQKTLQMFALTLAAFGLALTPQMAAAQAVEAPAAAVPEVGGELLPLDDAAAEEAPAPELSFEPYGPEMFKGVPTSSDEDMLASMTFQDQYTDDGAYALWMHDAILLPMVFGISLFVLGLLFWVIFRYNRKRNTVPSKTSHNTFIEVIWTVIPVIILVIIAVPSITLLASQYKTPPEDAITIKAIGNQWNWTYEYVDNGGFEVLSNMLNDPNGPKVNPSVRDVGSEPWDGPEQLEVDNRMVVPVGVPLRIQTFGSDVIHSFAVPALWFKMDAVPGRINEKMLTINEPGVYFGQCMELCGSRHGYMPIAVEARPLAEYEEWVRSKGGMTRAEASAAAAAEAAAASAVSAEEEVEADAENAVDEGVEDALQADSTADAV